MAETKIILREGERVFGELAVPFTIDEAELLRQIREEDKKPLVKEMAGGSGPIRQLISDWPVPWGYELLHRNIALAQIHEAAETINALLTKLELNNWRSISVENRDSVEESLKTILEKLKKFPRE
ncbi:MAG TPA: hypothetical protein VEA59_02925 [Patescibacteria group bacterium]|nr:hypothetical protein [Patescibacteria group bacterium]